MNPTERQRNLRTQQLVRASAIMRGGFPMSVGLLDTTAMPSPSGGDPVERPAEEVARQLRNEIFPVDPAFKRSTLATVRNTALSFSERLSAHSDLLRIARREGYSTMDAEVIRAGADLALSEPRNIVAHVVWENMLTTKRSELIPQIARALDIEPDTDFRLRLIKALASDFAGDPAARKVLEVAARGNGQQVVRMAALREVQGDANWHAYVAAALVDASLPALQRLQPLAHMAHPATKQATTRLQLDDKALRELIPLTGKLLDKPGDSTHALNAILALKSVDSPALADRLIDIARAPVNEQTMLTGLNSRSLKMAAISVAALRFPDDQRFNALLKEFWASSDAELSAWAKDEMEQIDAMKNPEARKALFDKQLQRIMPK